MPGIFWTGKGFKRTHTLFFKSREWSSIIFKRRLFVSHKDKKTRRNKKKSPSVPPIRQLSLFVAASHSCLYAPLTLKEMHTVEKRYQAFDSLIDKPFDRKPLVLPAKSPEIFPGRCPWPNSLDISGQSGGGWSSDCHAGDRVFISRGAKTQGLKITKEKALGL